AATCGPVAEPYLFSFPYPPAYFAFLLSGRYTTVEAFWYSTPWTSWMQTHIGDPLYTPFKKNPKITEAQLHQLLGITADQPPAQDVDLREMPIPKPEEEEKEEKKKTWIEILLVNEAGEPVSGEEYEITTPDGQIKKGRTNAQGKAKITGIDPGECKICFPRLDEEAWQRRA
ncbi:MAG TPA: hypothetical protein VM487_26255, partial [Phycisphaerae bacterium]|nr:hypothetical protein [Phycisphaerae bacterium]